MTEEDSEFEKYQNWDDEGLEWSDEVDEQLDEILMNSLRLGEDDFDNHTHFGEEGLDADSLELVEMAEAIEVMLDVNIPDEAIGELPTVGAVKAYVGEQY